MLYINGTDIRLTRGDTARFEVDIINQVDGKPYTLQEGDVLTLTVRLTPSTAEISAQRVAEPGTTSIYIRPEDTANLGVGQYVYDIQLTTAAGDIYTVIGPPQGGCNFVLLPEVTY